MSRGTILARHYHSAKPMAIEWQNGTITGANEVEGSLPEENLWIAPALFDVQINGFAGVDFQQDLVELEDLLHATRQLRLHGCARFLVTLITDEWPELIERLRRLRNLRSMSTELQNAIAGWHIEGPFLSQEPGFHGAHDPTLMLNPTFSHIEELRSVIDHDPLLLTLAPERLGALEIISACRNCGIQVSLGHTNALSTVLKQAIQAGASGFTHLGNACPRELDRHDNILWRILDEEALTIGIIPDSIHVSPTLFRLFHKVVPKDRIYYTTDAMAAAGAKPGNYTIGRLRLEVGSDEIVKQPGKTNFAGSALRPIDGIIRASEMLQRQWQDVWDSYSIIPARWLQCFADLRPGNPAHFCILQTTAENRIESIQTYFSGTLTEQKRLSQHQ